MQADMSRFSVVLCRAGESANVGAVCRAMKTMGIHRLILADCPVYDAARVATMAVHALDVYGSAERFGTLEEALRGFALSAGFTRRRGGRRKSRSLAVRDFAVGVAARSGEASSGGGRIALVFGNEKDGLTDAELALCSLAVHIPSSDAFPSLNLAQAVQVACHEMFSAALEAGGGKDGSADPASRAVTEAASADIARALSSLGFFSKTGDGDCREFLRDLMERAGLGTGEIEYFKRLFLKAAALSGGKGAPRRHAAALPPREAPSGQHLGADDAAFGDDHGPLDR